MQNGLFPFTRFPATQIDPNLALCRIDLQFIHWFWSRFWNLNKLDGRMVGQTKRLMDQPSSIIHRDAKDARKKFCKDFTIYTKALWANRRPRARPYLQMLILNRLSNFKTFSSTAPISYTQYWIVLAVTQPYPRYGEGRGSNLTWELKISATEAWRQTSSPTKKKWNS